MVVRRDAAGFSLTELLMVLAVFVVLAAITVPVSMDLTEQMRVNAAAREVERELQTARLKAVSTNRPYQIRINCPAAGQYRMVEVMRLAAIDNTAGRCNPAAYPYPSPKDGDFATPDHDGPVRLLRRGTTVTTTGTPVLQFLPDGRTFEVAGSKLEPIPLAGRNVVLTRGTHRATVNVNGLGKIRFVP